MSDKRTALDVDAVLNAMMQAINDATPMGMPVPQKYVVRAALTPAVRAVTDAVRKGCEDSLFDLLSDVCTSVVEVADVHLICDEIDKAVEVR